MSTSPKKSNEVSLDDIEKLEANPMASSGMLAFLPPLLQEMAKIGAKFTVSQEGKCLVDGFYKAGQVQIIPKNNKFYAMDKRERETVLNNVMDVAKLNYEWWKASQSKGVYIAPKRPWLDIFIEQGWVARQIIFVPKEDGQEGEEDGTKDKTRDEPKE